MSDTPTNPEGLTFAEWWAAATAFAFPKPAPTPPYQLAWRNGEDPTDHANYLRHEKARQSARELCAQPVTGGGDACQAAAERFARQLAASQRDKRFAIARACRFEFGLVSGYLWPADEQDTDADRQTWLTAFAILYARRYGAAPYFW